MADNDVAPAPLVIPERELPWPSTMSDEALQMSQFLYGLPRSPEPPGTDRAAWAELLAESAPTSPEQVIGTAMGTVGGVRTERTLPVSEVMVGSVPVFTAPSPEGVDDDRVLFALHGGGWTDGGGEVSRAAASLVATTYGLPSWVVDYRMPPEHPYPAALDDCVIAYKVLLESHDASRVAVFGMSAGGNLAAALMLRLAAEELPRPAVLLLNSPAVDLTGQGDTVEVHWLGNTVPSGRLSERARLYSGGHDLTDPELSPLFGDVSVFPPTALITGTRDVLQSDTVRLHRALRAAGVRADLHVFEGAPHGLFAGQAPEDREAARELSAFVEEHIPLKGFEQREMSYYLSLFAPMLERQKSMRNSQLEAIDVPRGALLFLGDSITEQGLWSEWFVDGPVVNRGVGGERSDEVLKRTQRELQEPAGVSLLIGTNDLTAEVEEDEIVANVDAILTLVREENVDVPIVLNSVMPRTADFRERIESLNVRYKTLAVKHGAVYLDLWPAFATDDGAIKQEFSLDDLHLTGAGYAVWVDLLRPELAAESVKV
ncbi:alpha/beta hydrolase fold domain-containing protein [Demequina globuliformis]|uniref:alpha/beta hydrolase fold domain-containing protein n=1 Tax=Demequina globuliformis TaxID=676202 RepID=UPI0007809BF4|nr:alpha/beta hydrolase fold domain-containing protein [Demequina globuliformis]